MTNVTIGNDTFMRFGSRSRGDRYSNYGGENNGARYMKFVGDRGTIIAGARGNINRNNALTKKMRNGKHVWSHGFDQKMRALEVNEQDGFILVAFDHLLFSLDYHSGEILWKNTQFSTLNVRHSTYAVNPNGDDYWYVGSNGGDYATENGIYKINVNTGVVVSQPNIFVDNDSRYEHSGENGGRLNAVETGTALGTVVYHQTDLDNTVLRAVALDDTEITTAQMDGVIREIAAFDDGLYIGTDNGVEFWPFNLDQPDPDWSMTFPNNNGVDRHILENPNDTSQLYTDEGMINKSDGSLVNPEYRDNDDRIFQTTRWTPVNDAQIIDPKGYVAYEGDYDDIFLQSIKTPFQGNNNDERLLRYGNATWTTMRGNTGVVPTISGQGNRSIRVNALSEFGGRRLINGTPSEYDDKNDSGIRWVTSYAANVTSNRFDGLEDKDIEVFYTVMNTVKGYDVDNIQYFDYQFANDTPLSLIADDSGGVYVGTEKGRLVHINDNETIDYDQQITNGYAILDMHVEYTDPNDYTQKKLYLQGDDKIYKVAADTGSIEWTYTSDTQIHQFCYVNDYEKLFVSEWPETGPRVGWFNNIYRLNKSDASVDRSWDSMSDYTQGRDSSNRYENEAPISIGTTGKHLIISDTRGANWIVNEDLELLYYDDNQTNGYSALQVDGFEHDRSYKDREQFSGYYHHITPRNNTRYIYRMPMMLELDKKTMLRIWDNGEEPLYINGSTDYSTARSNELNANTHDYANKTYAEILLNKGDRVVPFFRNVTILGIEMEQ